jgi:hypothetical protein
MGELEKQQDFIYLNYTVDQLFKFLETTEFDRKYCGLVSLHYDEDNNPTVQIEDILSLVNEQHQLIDPITKNLLSPVRKEFYEWLNYELFNSLFSDLSSYLSGFFLEYNLQTTLSLKQLLISSTGRDELRKLSDNNKMRILHVKSNIFDIEDLSKCLIQPFNSSAFATIFLTYSSDIKLSKLIVKFLLGQNLFPYLAHKERKQLSQLNKELRKNYFLLLYFLKIDALNNILKYKNEDVNVVNDFTDLSKVHKYPNLADNNFIEDLKRIIANTKHIIILTNSFKAISVRNKAFFSNFFNYYAFRPGIQPFFLNQSPDEFILIVQRYYPEINLIKLQDKKTQKTRKAFDTITFNYLNNK